ncbi:hypothetical protein KR038_005708, partial [Drosophila bunnanda]
TKMPVTIVTTEEVAHQRALTNKMTKLSQSWWRRFAWYPRMQKCHYRRVDQIYLECRQKYGDGHFLLYATRQRLAKKYTQTAADVEKGLVAHRTFETDGCVKSAVPETTNGEYGRLKPTSLHFC